MADDTSSYSGDDYLTTAEVATRHHVAKITVQRAVKAGRIVPLRTPGGHFRFRRADVDALFSGQVTA